MKYLISDKWGEIFILKFVEARQNYRQTDRQTDKGLLFVLG